GNSRLSSRLWRMSACGSLATPWTTLMRSKTTRRSAPITRSRLRSPTSKSTTATFCPACASAAPRAAVDVVLPTPPLPDVTTKTFAIVRILPVSIEGRDQHHIALQPSLDRPAAQARFHVLGGAVVAVGGRQLGFHLVAKNAGARVSGGARHGAAAQRAIDVDRSAGDDFGAGRHRAEDGHVACREDDRLARAHRGLQQQRAGLRRNWRDRRRRLARRWIGQVGRFGLVGLFHRSRGASALEGGREPPAQLRRGGALGGPYAAV